VATGYYLHGIPAQFTIQSISDIDIESSVITRVLKADGVLKVVAICYLCSGYFAAVIFGFVVGVE
jgi:hypothetical protein